MNRAGLTDAVLAQLETLGHPIGLATSPDNAGWEGQPNKDLARFRPYAVLTPAPASISEGPLTEPQADWRIPYVISSYGVDPRQTERLADRLRAAVTAMKKTTVDGHRVQQVWTAAMGAVVRFEGLDPKIWAQTDTVVLWMTPSG